MAPTENIVTRQQYNLEEVNRVVRNFSKDAASRHSRQYFTLREELIVSKWNACEDLHFEMNQTLKDSEKLPIYIQEYEKMEEIVHEHKEHFRQRIAEYVAKENHDAKVKGDEVAPIQATTSAEVSEDTFVSLERIPIPKFDGTYTNWASFSDLFKHMIHNNKRLFGVQKMHYLRTSVVGEAEQIIKHLSITEANYTSAWKLLCDRFDNKRITANAFVKLLWDLKPISSHNASGIKSILNTTNEVLNSFKNLGVATQDILLLHLLQQKLDQETSIEWQKHIGGSTEIPTIAEFLDFLRQRTTIIEATKSMEKTPRYSVHATNVYSEQKCHLCNGAHKMQQCLKFNKAKESDRREMAKKFKLCFNCLSSKHQSITCQSTNRCRTCKGKHHTLLHMDYGRSSNEKTPSAMKAIVKQGDATTAVLLATAIIWIKNAGGLFIPLRALLDQGSQRSFITEAAAQQLGLIRQSAKILINGIGKHQAQTRGSIHVECKPTGTHENIMMTLLILSKITDELPQSNIAIASVKKLKNLADPYFHKRGRIDLLIGSDIFADVILPGFRKLSPGKLIMQNTKFGWILSGPTDTNTTVDSHVAMVSLQELNDNIKQFWEVEEITSTPHLTPEEESCESHFAQTTRRDLDSGRYTVRLPFKTDYNPSKALAPSMKGAISRWLQIERKLEQNINLKIQYHEFLEEYLNLGHMEEVPAEEIYTRPSYYLPHHAVIKESSTTTKLRVVFDASYRTSSGKSLNDILMVGPKVQNDITSVILKWRLHKVVMTGDIEKMYRQVLVDPRDRDYLRIVWRPVTPGPIKHYRLNTVTYGTASAAYQAVKTLNKPAIDDQFNYSQASAVVLSDFYVDDLLTGSNDVNSAMELQKNTTKLLAAGGFNIRKWASNNPELLSSVPEADRANPGPIEINFENTIKTLGLQWNPQLDIFNFKLSLPNIEGGIATKRQVASNIAKLFDPLGWLQPVIVTGKIFLQKLWLLEVDWDHPLPDEVSTEWKNYITQCSSLKDVKIPRYVGTSKKDKIELHGFSDASSDAFAAAIYLRVVDCVNRVRINLLAAKTKVAPIKVQSIPRLELCGAVLLTKLIQNVKKSLNFDSSVPTFYWTDSTIVLSWLADHPNKWTTYVANRVSEIHSSSESSQWRHVESKWNPADCASRGLPSSKLVDNALWWEGPTWLHTVPVTYSSGAPIQQDNTERRRIRANIINQADIGVSANLMTNSSNILSRFSCFNRLTRIVAYCLRFKYKDWHADFLSSTELQRAKLACVRMSQQSTFSEEIHQLLKEENISSTSRLITLCPQLDKHGILRVGGRLQNADLSDARKHPIILSSDCKLAELVVRFFHLKTLHGSNQLTTAAIREEFWVPQLQKLVKSCIHKCIICFKTHATAQTQLMGSLPKERVIPSRAFSKVGLDFAGPIIIKWSSGRGAKTTKSYIALFICLCTKAIHLEVVSDLTSKACIAAIKRFIARRGLCTDIYSDCGTNFIGASKEIKAQFDLLKYTTQAYLANEHITWHFNPPSSPHFGGLWEAGVKSVKLHLTKTIGEALLNMEELYTVLAEIEAVLNSRPLVPMSNDINDDTPLTPGHFLIGQPLLSLPQQPPEADMQLLKRWQLTTQMVQNFWKRWSSEYLSRLQNRPKWLKPKANLRVGQLVLVKDENYPPTKWPLARIVDVHPGADGLVRVATIKLNNRKTKRSVVKLCPLPVPEAEIETPTATDQPMDVDSPTSTTNTPEANGRRQPTRSKRQPVNYANMLMFLLVTCFVPFTKAYNQSHIADIQPVESGFVIEHIGKAHLIRGAAQLHVKLTWDEILQDKINVNETLHNITTVCNSSSAFPFKVNCLHLIHHLSDMKQHIYDEIKMIHFIKGRSKRGLLGKMLTAVFGVNDEVYQDIETLQANQQTLKTTVYNETKLFLRATHQLNITNERINKQMIRFNDRYNDAVQVINKFITNHQEDNIRFLELYQRALNFLQAVHDKYTSIIKVIHKNSRISELFLPSEFMSIINRLEGSLSSPLQIMHIPRDDITIQFLQDSLHIFGYFNIIESEDYELIKATPVPCFLPNRTFFIYDVAPAIIGVNFNNQHYFEISEQELLNSHGLSNSTYVMSINTLFDMRTKSNCLIKEFYKLYEGTKCPVKYFNLASNVEIIWKKLYSKNKWLFASSNVVPAHTVYHGVREEILLNHTGILNLKPGSKLITNQHILISDQLLTEEAFHIYIKNMDTPLLTTNERPHLISGTNIIKSSEDFTILIDDAQQLYDGQQTLLWRNYHHRWILPISTLSIFLTIICLVLIIIFACIRNNKKKIATQPTVNTSTHWYDLDDLRTIEVN